jgi:DNA-binding transcriptional LysR family regulator
LFDRLGRKVLLTEAGCTLLPRARHILAELEDSRRALRNLSGRVAGKLSLAISHHIGLHRLPPVLRLFTSQYSQVRLDLHFLDSEVACEAVIQGEVELGIVTLPPRPQPPLSTLPIWTDDLVVVIQRNHPLAAISEISSALLSLYPAIVPDKTTFSRTIIDRAFAPIALTVAFSTNYLETIKMMVSVGLGWSLLPQSMLDGELTTLRPQGLEIRRSLGVVQHSGRTLSNAAQAMLELLRQQIR